MNTKKTINSLKNKIVESVSARLNEISELNNYEIVWKQLQDISAQIIIEILEKELKQCNVSIPESKSVYPDIKIETNEGLFAIDIKANEGSKQPWFDMARLDTINERFKNFKEEWEFIIKYDSTTKKFMQAYFLPFKDVVGKRNDCSGVKYRPYDGKLRPKNWEDFENDVTHWKTKSALLKGIKISSVHRWENNIKKHLIPILSKKQKEEFKNMF